MTVREERNNTRHREAAAASRAETRRRLLESAAREFTASGYAGATVTRIAAGAGVTVQTLYLAWGSKGALLRAYLELALSGGSETPYPQELPGIIDAALRGVEADPHAVMKRISSLYLQITQRSAVAWRLYREAALTDPEIAQDWQAVQLLRRQTFGAIIGRLPARSLRPGLTREQAADTAWAIASPETYELMIGTRGYTPAQFEKWISATLSAALLRP